MNLLTFERNVELELGEYPSLTSNFVEDDFYINLQWELEKIFMNVYERESFTVTAYEVEGDNVIIADGLPPFDHKHLSAAEDYQTYVMPNGQLLIDYYADHIVDINVYLDNLDNINKKGFVSRRFSFSTTEALAVSIDPNYEKMYVGVRFYDENDTVIIPSTGTVQISGISLVGGSTFDSPNGTLDATSASPMVNVETPVETISATPSGLSNSVAKWQMIVWQL